MSFRLIFARGSGPRVRQDPGVPRAFLLSKARTFANLGRKMRRENAGG
jgi:hypothetical protein